MLVCILIVGEGSQHYRSFCLIVYSDKNTPERFNPIKASHTNTAPASMQYRNGLHVILCTSSKHLLFLLCHVLIASLKPSNIPYTPQYESIGEMKQHIGGFAAVRASSVVWLLRKHVKHTT